MTRRPLKVNYFAAAPGEDHNVSLNTNGREAPVLDCNSVCLGITSVERRELTVAEN